LVQVALVTGKPTDTTAQDHLSELHCLLQAAVTLDLLFQD
jgi:hypothetical protein